MYKVIGGISVLSLTSFTLFVASSSESKLEGYYNQANEILNPCDPNPPGSLSEKVLVKLYEGMKETSPNDLNDNTLSNMEKRDFVDENVKEQITDLLYHFEECKDNNDTNEISMGQCVIENHGFHTIIKPSTLGPFSGDGCFVRESDNNIQGNIPPYSVVSIYEGDLISPWIQLKSTLTGNELVENEWLLSRGVDGYVVDGKPYGSEDSNYDEIKDILSDESIHVGQLVNHSPPYTKPNVAYYHIVISKDDPIYSKINTNLLSIGDENDYSDDIRLSVIISLDEIREGEELFSDYGYCPIYHWSSNEFEQPKLMLPPWYHPVKE